MASHQIAIAKATFAASLLRPDPIPVPRDDIAQFHTLLGAVSTQCSPTNIQRCKRWVLSNVVQSTTRITALAKFLAALSASFSDADRSTLISAKRETSAKRKRLHILYLISDLIYHTKIRNKDTSFADNLLPLLINLFSSAASFQKSPKHLRKVENLVDIWAEKHYYSTSDINKIRQAVETTQRSGSITNEPADSDSKATSNVAAKSAKDVPFTMPAMHGDQNLPWYDLPAGNLMQHIIPNSTRPIDPTLVKPMRFVPGQADEELVASVKAFLEEVETIYDPVARHDENEAPAWDMDEVGRRIFRDDLGDVVAGDEGYYGWSTALCEKMKKRMSKNKSDGPAGTERSRGADRNFSRSRSSSRDSRHTKKRRYASSHASSRSRSRSRSRSPSQSRFRSRNIPFEGSQPEPMPHSTAPPHRQQHQQHQQHFPPPPPQSASYHGSHGQQYQQWQQPPPPPPQFPDASQWQQPTHGYQATPGGRPPQYPPGRDSGQQPGAQGGSGYGHNNNHPGYRGSFESSFNAQNTKAPNKESKSHTKTPVGESGGQHLCKNKLDTKVNMTAHISFIDGNFSLIHIPLSLYSSFLQPILRVLLPHDIVVPKSEVAEEHMPDPTPVHGKQGFLNVSITPIECSIVCRTEYAESVFQPAVELLSEEARGLVSISQEPYQIFSISSAGMEASQKVMDLTAPLAMAGIPIFFITTYYTDFILVPGKDHKTVVQALVGQGFVFSESDAAYVAPSGISHHRDTSSEVSKPSTPPPSSVIELQERTFRLLSQRNVVPFIKDDLYLAQCSGKELDSSSKYSSRPISNDSNEPPAHATWLEKVDPNLYLSIVAALAIQPRFLSVTLTKDDAPSLLIDKALLYLFGNFIAGDTDCDLVPIFLDLSNLPLESTGIVCGVAGRLVDQTRSLRSDDDELSYLSTARAGVVILSSERSETALKALVPLLEAT
ncbi:hypothetical protein V494_05897 [Pseudogymnoascus sp. VKM F-4513 (FW-928)]|nr:hypothetical protein V494_05897 [Pseudogymnoascus sp. VKM F-4513 (FW-928)]